MATNIDSMDSSVVELRYAEEETPGVLPVTPIWYKLEPNEYDDFGGEYTLLARRPINASRQRKKGVIVDLNAEGGFTVDMTQVGLQDILQGFMFADTREKPSEAVTAVDPDAGNPDEYEVASTTGFVANSLILGSGFAEAANNGLKLVTAVVSNTSVEVATGSLTAEASPPADAKITVVGYQGAAGTLDILNSGAPALPRLVSASGPDFTTFGLIPGEWMFVGGASSGQMFDTAGNQNFWGRIHTIAAGYVQFDKTSKTLVTEDNSATNNATVRFFFGHVLKNEADPSLIVKRSYNLERSLGAPDTAQPSEIQGEYLVGAVANELTLTAATADKLMVEMGFIGMDHETVTGAVGLKSGTRPSLEDSDAYNSSNDFSGFKISLLDRTGGANPSALVGYVTEFELAINNNVSPNKAISVLGAFSMTAGMFDVTGKATAYFTDVATIAAIRDNSDVTMDMTLVKNNKGVVVDIPLIALGDGRNEVEIDEPIMFEVEMPAAADTLFDHTLLFNFFDYLPDSAG